MAYVKSLSEVPYLSKKGLQDRYFLFLKYKEKTMAEKKIKQVCKCENCGNEAEMMITCSLEEHEEKPIGSSKEQVIIIFHKIGQERQNQGACRMQPLWQRGRHVD